MIVQGVAKDFAFGLYELDWDTFAFNIEHCMKRVPVIEETGLKSTVCGPGECYCRFSTSVAFVVFLLPLCVLILTSVKFTEWLCHVSTVQNISNNYC